MNAATYARYELLRTFRNRRFLFCFSRLIADGVFGMADPTLPTCLRAKIGTAKPETKMG